MGTILDTSLFFVRDAEHLIRVMSTNPSYLQSQVDGDVVQYRDWGIPLGRRFRALKLWFHLKLDGIENIRARLRRDLENARWLADQVTDHHEWELVSPLMMVGDLISKPATIMSGNSSRRSLCRRYAYATVRQRLVKKS